MKPSIHTIILLIALLAAAIVAALLADAWRSARHDTAQLAATLASQNTAIQQSADREKQRDSHLSTALAAIAAQKKSVQTPQQAANAIPSVMPPLPLPISISIPDAQLSSKSATDLPATVTIPQTDLKPLYDDLQDCRATALQSASLTKDLADEKSTAAALTTERDAAVAATHGGTFVVRLKREAKWLAIGIAVGAVTAEAAHHR
jgi:hypothetical protein